MAESGNSSSEFEFDEDRRGQRGRSDYRRRPHKKRRPARNDYEPEEELNESDEDEYEWEEESQTGDSSYRRERKPKRQQRPPQRKKNISRKTPESYEEDSDHYSLREEDDESEVSDEYITPIKERRYSSPSSHGDKTRKRTRKKRFERSPRSSAWEGEWIQVKRMMWRLNRYLENRYYEEKEQSEKGLSGKTVTQKPEKKQVRLFRKNEDNVRYSSRKKNRERNQRAIAVTSKGYSGKSAENRIWKLAATTGSIGLSLLLLLNLLPTEAKVSDIDQRQVEVIDTRTSLPVNNFEIHDGPIPYEIVLIEQPDFPSVAFVPEEPEEVVIIDEPEEPIIPEFAPEPVIEITDNEPFYIPEEEPIEPDIIPEFHQEEPEISMELVRIPLTGEFAKYAPVEKEVELFTVYGEYVLPAENITNSEYDQFDGKSLIENTSAAIINDRNWNRYQVSSIQPYSEIPLYEGGNIPESISRSENFVPENIRNKKSLSIPDHTINVEIEKVFPKVKAIGSTQEYTIVVRNVSDETIDELNVSEFIPAEMKVLHADPVASFTGQELAWKFHDLKAGATKKILIQVEAKKAGMIQSVAYVQPVVAIASESYVEAARANLQLSMSMPDPVPAGDHYPVRYQVRNLGDEDVSDLVLVTDLPLELDHRFGRRLKYEVGTLKAGENREIILQAVADRPGDGIQTAELVSATGNSPTVSQNVRVIAASRTVPQSTPSQPSSPQPVKQATPRENCCCWKISFHR